MKKIAVLALLCTMQFGYAVINEVEPPKTYCLFDCKINKSGLPDLSGLSSKQFYAGVVTSEKTIYHSFEDAEDAATLAFQVLNNNGCEIKWYYFDEPTIILYKEIEPHTVTFDAIVANIPSPPVEKPSVLKRFLNKWNN